MYNRCLQTSRRAPGNARPGGGRSQRQAECVPLPRAQPALYCLLPAICEEQLSVPASAAEGGSVPAPLRAARARCTVPWNIASPTVGTARHARMVPMVQLGAGVCVACVDRRAQLWPHAGRRTVTVAGPCQRDGNVACRMPCTVAAVAAPAGARKCTPRLRVRRASGGGDAAAHLRLGCCHARPRAWAARPRACASVAIKQQSPNPEPAHEHRVRTTHHAYRA